MRTVHLCMMKLERNSKCCFELMAFVFSPNYKRIVEYPAIHTYRTIYFVFSQCRCANHHTLMKIVINATIRDLSGQMYIMLIKFKQIISKGISHELTSPFLLATMVLTPMVSYCINLSPTGNK